MGVGGHRQRRRMGKGREGE
uniref:Uncharacterized protein n=1 Tax=Arundo donax TaxID=35708 RepID=A0A0A8YDG2_ARUDO